MPVEKGSSIVKLSLPSVSLGSWIYYGATLTSWIAGGKERLFLSSKAALDGSKAIRGGIPICWPNFGPPPSADDETLVYHSKLAQHGFARNQTWTLDSVVMDRPEGVSVRFTLDPTPSIISIFPYPFHLSYVVTLTKHELSTDLHVVNPSAKDSLLAAAQTVSDAVTSALPTAVTGSESKPQDKGLRFQTLFHTYLAVSDSSTVKAQGLRSGLNYVDKIKGGSKEVWEGGDLKFDQAVDRVYYGKGKDDIVLVDGQDKLTVHSVEMPDITTWNPAEGAAKIADMEEGGEKRYVCLEPGRVDGHHTLQPGQELLMQQVLRIE
ncbi:hypothetical protein FFLO_04516 [Filobasidium floriforme]|uniref:Glucose-6-phosphate 1-epimerase n=1 Tax=Filobasidium floriforme TaxID=5210 RepID=A0A8K0NS64_9TREE|nr:hypothetical protein FFLO_04516 [Filobasidium floriforme]